MTIYLFNTRNLKSNLFQQTALSSPTGALSNWRGKFLWPLCLIILFVLISICNSGSSNKAPLHYNELSERTVNELQTFDKARIRTNTHKNPTNVFIGAKHNAALTPSQIPCEYENLKLAAKSPKMIRLVGRNIEKSRALRMPYECEQTVANPLRIKRIG